MQSVSNLLDLDPSAERMAGGFRDFPSLQVTALLLGAASLHLITVMFQFVVTDMAVTRLDGQSPTLRDAWGALAEHGADIVGLSIINLLVAAAFAKIKAWLDRRWGDAAADAAHTAWHCSTSLTIPALVMNPGLSVREGMQESMHLFRRTWGENLAAHAAIALAARLLGGFFMMLWTVGCAWYLPTLHSVTYINGLVVIGWAMGIPILLVSSTFNAMLYRYARFDEVPDHFDRSDLKGFFAARPPA